MNISKLINTILSVLHIRRRIYIYVRWNRPRHERITGHHSYIYLPAEEEYSLLHIKNSADDHKKWIEYDAEYQNKVSSK